LAPNRGVADSPTLLPRKNDAGCWLERSGNPDSSGILDAGWSEAEIPIHRGCWMLDKKIACVYYVSSVSSEAGLSLRFDNHQVSSIQYLGVAATRAQYANLTQI